MSKGIEKEHQEILELLMRLDDRGLKLVLPLIQAHASKDDAAVERAKEAICNECGIDPKEVRA